MPLPHWLKITVWGLAAFAVGVALVIAALAWYVRSQILDSGGPLPATMAAYDVRRYDLGVTVDPEERRIRGSNVITVTVADPLDSFECHLDHRLRISRVEIDGEVSPFEHRRGIVRAELSEAWSPGERHTARIAYAGRPKRALRPPWIDGFVWKNAASGEPWVGVTTQGDGADIWWPCKDHPSDEPDEGMGIVLTVPSTLVGLSNGRRVSEEVNLDGTITTRWEVSYPINNYLVTVSIGPYVPIEASYHGVDGDLDASILFWSLPERAAEAERMWQQAPRILEVLAHRFGEYPFLEDKLWVAHSPYLGMEHQTLVGYGGEFVDNRFGFDDLLLHEIAHEWWGNKISVSDWSDFWLQEGFATYAEALYVYDTVGLEPYLDYMRGLRRGMRNSVALVAGDDLTSAEAYHGDIYEKGAWILHTLRYLVGDEVFFRILIRFATDPAFAYGLVTSEDLFELVTKVSGLDLGWFWQRYLYRADLPMWSLARRPGDEADRLELTWDDPAFEMPLPVRLGDDMRRVGMSRGSAVLEVPSGTPVEVDPEGWVLCETQGRSDG